MRLLRHPSAIRTLLCLLWGAGILAGLYEVTAYSNTPGEIPEQSGQWPAGAKIPLASDRSTLLVTLHPHCVCSRASLEELARLLARIPKPVEAHILLYQPATASEAWTESDLTAQVRSLPGVVMTLDPNGDEAKRFGMAVSGHTALYAPDGRLLFSGGITQARGHAGDNTGRAAILSILSNRRPQAVRTPVFGCSIRDSRQGS